jgi:hypothetical protein
MDGRGHPHSVHPLGQFFALFLFLHICASRYIWLLCRPPTSTPVQLMYRYCELGTFTYEDVSKSFRIGRLERELQMVQLSATRCSCIAILWVSLVNFATITLCVSSQQVIPKVSVYFVIDSVRKLLVTPAYVTTTSYRILPRACLNDYEIMSSIFPS